MTYLSSSSRPVNGQIWDRPAPDRSGAQARAGRRAVELAERYAGRDGADLLRPIIEREFPGRIAVVSSFGAEAAVTLQLVAAIDPAVPVIFLDTDKHFPETLAYRDDLVARLGLRDVRWITPDPESLEAEDPDGRLWAHRPDRCCHLRKVRPLRRALAGFDAWITGRKRYQGGARSTLTTIEADDERIKINPLANWRPAQIAAAYEAGGLPPHPLVARGYLSIGCAPCTHRTPCGASARAGRWLGAAKSECGIHWSSGPVT